MQIMNIYHKQRQLLLILTCLFALILVIRIFKVIQSQAHATTRPKIHLSDY